MRVPRVVGVGFVALACAGEAAPSIVAIDAGAAGPPMLPIELAAPSPIARARPTSALEGWLAGCAVSDADFLRHKLYTWTTAERIEELTADRVLLAHGRIPGEMSRFDVAITADRHPLANHLRHERRGRRYAWVAPWATRMGWEGHDYGEHLVEITLQPHAWVARFAPGTDEPWRVVDEEGRVVPADEVRRHLGRVAAVYHVADGENAYRELIVVDERHVERWAVATPAIRERLASDARFLRALAAAWREDTPASPEDFAAWLRDGWNGEGEDRLTAYRACLALGSPHYTPSAEHLDAIADALDATPLDTTLEHTVVTSWMFGDVLGTRTQCDPTYGCWEQWLRRGTVRAEDR